MPQNKLRVSVAAGVKNAKSIGICKKIERADLTEMFGIEIAGHRFRVDNKFEYVKKLCRDYLCEDASSDAMCDCSESDNSAAYGISCSESEPEVFHISVSEAELKREIVPDQNYPDAYLESTGVYRKLCEHLIPEGFFLFHCSALAFDGKGLLFTAPSGTGKSTHARLWKEHLGDRVVIVNDDKPLIKIENGEAKRIMVCGTPWSGKHSMQTNTQVPVHALYLLERGEENSVTPVSAQEAYPMILHQTYRPDKPELMIQTLKMINEFISQVPIYRLKCNISYDAVETSMSVV